MNRKMNGIEASVTGRRASSPPSDHPAAGLVLPSVVGTRAATPCGQRGAGGPIQGRVVAAEAAPLPNQRLAGPASRRRDLKGAGPTRPAPNSPSSLVSRSRGRRLLAEAELAAVDPEVVQNGRELARQRHLGPPHAAPLRHLQAPPLQGRELTRAGH